MKGGELATSLANAATRRSIRIINVVTESSFINRVKQIRGVLPSGLKSGGTVATASVDISGVSGLKNEFYAHSKIHVLADARSAQNAVADISLQLKQGSNSVNILICPVAFTLLLSFDAMSERILYSVSTFVRM